VEAQRAKKEARRRGEDGRGGLGGGGVGGGGGVLVLGWGGRRSNL